MKENEIFAIGSVVRVHGVKGKIELAFTDDVFMRAEADYLFFRIDGLPVPFFLEECSLHGKGRALLKLEDVDSADAAKNLLGCEVLFPKAMIVEREVDAASWEFLVGFEVWGKNEGNVGKVEQVNTQSTNTLLHVKTPQGKEVLIPFHSDLLTDLDENKRTLMLDLPEGLLALYE